MSTANPVSTRPEQPSLRLRTTRGVMWVAAQAGATRIITLIQQIVLGWLLAKSDFGLIAMTYTVSALVTLMANPGIDAVVVQRMRRYRHWATPAFWLGMTMSCVGAVAMLILAPITAWAYGRPEISGLISVLAFALPLQALQIVPKAQLRMQMRFRAIVLLGLTQSTTVAVLTIAGAYFGFGAYSFVVPVPIAAAVVATATWHLARPPVRRHADFSRWKYLFGRSATVGVTQLLNAFVNQADYMVLGAAGVADTSIGAYKFGFDIAIQPLRLISSNVPMVLFPGLTHLSQDRPKQVRAALRAMRLLTLVIVPVCMLQLLLAPAAFRLVLPPQWAEAVLPCQLLTVGLMVNAACWPAISLIQAQGRFREQMWATVAATLLFLILIGVAIGWRPGILSVAMAVMTFHLINSPFLHWVSFRRDASLSSFAIEFGPPLVAGMIAAVPAAILIGSLPETWWGGASAIVAGSALYTIVYAIATYLIVPNSVNDLLQQLLPIWRRLQGTPATSEEVAVEAAIIDATESKVTDDGDKLP